MHSHCAHGETRRRLSSCRLRRAHASWPFPRTANVSLSATEIATRKRSGELDGIRPTESLSSYDVKFPTSFFSSRRFARVRRNFPPLHLTQDFARRHVPTFLRAFLHVDAFNTVDLLSAPTRSVCNACNCVRSNGESAGSWLKWRAINHFAITEIREILHRVTRIYESLVRIIFNKIRQCVKARNVRGCSVVDCRLSDLKQIFTYFTLRKMTSPL